MTIMEHLERHVFGTGETGHQELRKFPGGLAVYLACREQSMSTARTSEWTSPDACIIICECDSHGWFIVLDALPKCHSCHF